MHLHWQLEALLGSNLQTMSFSAENLGHRVKMPERPCLLSL